jgi:hypothetical protein
LSKAKLGLTWAAAHLKPNFVLKINKVAQCIVKTPDRRWFIKTALVAALGLRDGRSILMPSLTTQEKPTMMTTLIETLISSHNPVCKTAAAQLILLPDNIASYDLHLRNANLNQDDIALIAKAINSVHSQGGPLLGSFSMSYNANLHDQGVLSLVKFLGASLTEVGLVQCGIGDKGGDALIAWASKAPNLKWLCVEHNAFSEQSKQKLVALTKEHKQLLVVV